MPPLFAAPTGSIDARSTLPTKVQRAGLADMTPPAPEAAAPGPHSAPNAMPNPAPNPAHDPAHNPAHNPVRSPLARRFARQVAGISLSLLIVAGAVEGYFGYREARQQLAHLQAVQAHAAAAEIEQSLRNVQHGFEQVQALPWGQADFDVPRRREELHRLLALNPSLVEVRDLDAQGCELLFVSRRLPDRVAPAQPPQEGAAPQAATLGFGSPYFDDSAAAHLPLALRRSGAAAVTSVALINLRFLSDVVSGLRVAEGGRAYVVDATDHLIAHADPTQALRRRMLASHGPVVAARAALAAGAAHLPAMDSSGLEGGPTITTAVPLQSPPWLVFVEQPRAAALQPAWATLQRSLLLLIVGAGVATAASWVFARRMAAPISTLRRATARLAAGQLGAQLQVRTGDEIEGLADDFNIMSLRLRQSYDELEDRVLTRTAELAASRDEALRANAAKTRFLAAASHDLRQPMHAIGLLIALLRERLPQPELRALADKAQHATSGMEVLFGGLLDISKLDAGVVQARVETFALHSLLDQLRLSYAPLAASKGLRLRLRAPQVVLHTDPVLLLRILGNLVANAIRYTHAGGVLVGVRRHGDGLALQVIDTGIGIAAEQLEAVFEEFVRLGNTHDADDPGLGLGLAIVKRSAQVLGLPLRVVSTPGRGSMFELLVPAFEVAWAPPAAQAAHVLDASVLQGAFVIVIDDDARGRDATVGLIAQWGALVVSAASAQAALVECAQHLRAPDVIVTDQHLGPGPDGLALIEALRVQAEAMIPAVLVSAEMQIDQRGTAELQVLHKPAGALRLRAALVTALRREVGA